MRVLQVIQELRVGGAERVVLTLCRELAVAGHEVGVAAAPGPLAVEARALGTKVFPLPMLRRRPWMVPVAGRAVQSATANWRADIVHAHNPGVAAAVALGTARGRRVPAIVSMHGVPEEDYGRAARLLRLSGLPVVACGPGVAAALQEHGCRPRGVIPNGVTAPPPPGDRAEVEANYGVPHGSRLVVAVGRLVPQKHHALAVTALRYVPDAVLVVFGDGPLRSKLEATAEAEGVGERVRFAGARPEVRRVMATADVVVLSSRWEGLPLVGLEAAAAGRPLVATAVRGVRELFTDGEDCLLVPHDDPAALGTALNRVLDDPALAQRLGAGARHLANAYTVEAMVRSFGDLYAQEVDHCRRG